MDGIAPWAAGVAMTLLAMLGLSLASGAVDLPFQIFGLALFLFGVACVFGLITRHTGGERLLPTAGDPADASLPAAAAPAPQPAAIASRA
jgi:hypothetical protein